jgi:hypothetical protein
MKNDILDKNGDNIACRVFITATTHEIIYINSVLDSYEGVGIMRTADESAGKIVIYTTKYFEQIVLGLIEALNTEGVRISVDKVDYEDCVG